MKKCIFFLILFPLAGKAGIGSATVNSTVLVTARSGDWPISLEKNDESRGMAYFLEFRDEQVLTSVVLDTLPFADLNQLKYFEQALSTLTRGNNGDVAQFKDYSIKRAESKKDGKWYILRYQWGLVNFQQPCADSLIKTIRKL